MREAGVDFEIAPRRADPRGRLGLLLPLLHATYRAHRSTPYLTRDFFARMAHTMPDHWLLFIAERDGLPHRHLADRARSGARPCLRPLLGRDRARRLPALRGLLLPAAAWCIEHGYRRFEGGAQGEHKMARGLLPVRDRIGPLAGAPAVRRGGGRLPAPRRPRGRGLHRRTGRAASVQVRSTADLKRQRPRIAGPSAGRRAGAVPATPLRASRSA